MSFDSLCRRMNRMIEVVGQQIVDAKSDEDERHLHLLTQEALCRRFALITPEHTLPDDFAEQCRMIDEDIESRMTPELRAVEQRFQQKYAGELVGCRAELERRLEAMHESEEAYEQS